MELTPAEGIPAGAAATARVAVPEAVTAVADARPAPRAQGAGVPLRARSASSDRYMLLSFLAVALCLALLLSSMATSIASTFPLLVALVALSALVLARDITAARGNGRPRRPAAEDGDGRFASLVRNASDVIAVVDTGATIRFVSPSAERVLGRSPEMLVGCSLTDFVHPDDVARVRAYIAETASGSGVRRASEWRLQDAAGDWMPVETIGTDLLADTSVAGIVLTMRDVRERKALERELTHLAFHDPLTNLANRALFRDRVEHALKRARRASEDVSLLFLDLDGFKRINDSWGHGQGDQLLREVAQRLLASIRAEDTAARFGGDEFAILLENATGAEGAETVAERIVEALRRPHRLGDRDVEVTVSVGIAIAADGQGQAVELMRNADVAMYAAKEGGKDGWAVFDPTMHEASMRRVELELDLSRVVARGELVLHYQPLVELATDRFVGAEALVRWHHPTRGLLAPRLFIPLAEDTGAIVEIGRWVLRTACHEALRWRSKDPSDPPRPVSVNLSARQLQDPALVADVETVLVESGLPPSSLTLEITESVLMRDMATTIERLGQLKALGVRLAIDDFGTGYSSLSYLRSYPVDELKIDRSFVEGLDRDEAGSAVVQAIVQLGAALGLATVAEGIERAAQADVLRRLGCRAAQGFHYARPISGDELVDLLARWRPVRMAAVA